MNVISLHKAVAKFDIILEPRGFAKPLRSSAALPKSIWTPPDKATVWKICSRRAHQAGLASSVHIKMPLAHAFGARHTKTTANGHKQYGMVLKYPMAQSSAILDDLRTIHAMLKEHLALPHVFNTVMPDTARKFAQQIFQEDSTLSDDCKTALFVARASARVESLFGGDSAFKVYTDYDTIVLGNINVPESLATADFLRNFGGHNDDPYVCLADVVVSIYAIRISPDEKRVSIDFRTERISHGNNISSECLDPLNQLNNFV